jgi:hypothetical protein
MGSSDNFCLRWNDFESNISTSFRELREDSEFFDVTLCCDNGTDIVPAHKVILAACSPLFRKILSRQKNQQNPFLYLKGIKLKELQAVLNFMYHGEVNVAQDSLNNFLAVAEELAVKGLTTDSKPTGPDTPAKKAVAAKRKTSSLPPGTSSTSQTAKKPKPSSSQASAPGEDIVDMVEPHLEDVDIKSIKAEPEPSGSGSGAGGGAHMVEADLGDESYGAGGADGDDNGDFGAEGEFEGFDQYGDGNEFDDSMGAAGGSGAAADGKDLEEAQFIQSFRGHAQLVDKIGYIYNKHQTNKDGTIIWWRCKEFHKKSLTRCRARATTEGFFITGHSNTHTHPPQSDILLPAEKFEKKKKESK